MENRSDDFNPFFSELDQSLVLVEKRLEIQIKPIAQWLKHLDRLCHEVDAGAVAIFDPDQERISTTSYQQFSTLPTQPLPSEKQAEKRTYKALQPTIEQLQDLALKAQKEVYQLQLQLQFDAPTTGLKPF